MVKTGPWGQVVSVTAGLAAHWEEIQEAEGKKVMAS